MTTTAAHPSERLRTERTVDRILSHGTKRWHLFLTAVVSIAAGWTGGTMSGRSGATPDETRAIVASAMSQAIAPLRADVDLLKVKTALNEAALTAVQIQLMPQVSQLVKDVSYIRGQMDAKAMVPQ